MTCFLAVRSTLDVDGRLIALPPAKLHNNRRRRRYSAGSLLDNDNNIFLQQCPAIEQKAVVENV